MLQKYNRRRYTYLTYLNIQITTLYRWQMTVVCSGLVDGLIHSSAKSLFLYILWVAHCTSWSPFKKLLAVRLHSVHVHQDWNSNDSNNPNQREWARKVRTHAVCCFCMSLIKLQLTKSTKNPIISQSAWHAYQVYTSFTTTAQYNRPTGTHLYANAPPLLMPTFPRWLSYIYTIILVKKKGCFVKSSAGTLPFLHWRKWEGSSTTFLPDMEYHIVLHKDRSGLWMQSFTNHWMNWPVIPSHSPAASTWIEI